MCCPLRTVASSVSASTPGYGATTATYNDLMNSTGAFFTDAGGDTGKSYSTSKVVIFSASSVGSTLVPSDPLYE